MKVAVVGFGYLGTVTAACLTSRDHDVWGVDVDAATVDEILVGRSTVAEPDRDALVAQAVSAGTLRATTFTPPRHLIDLTGRLGSEVESLPGYEGLG